MSANTEEREAVHVLASTPQKRINEVHRFSLLTIAFFGSIIGSFGYAFNIISGEMQVRYNFSMTDLSTIIAVGSGFGYFMIPWSFLYDYFGPRPLTIPAFILFFTGQICMAMCFNGKVEGSVVRLTVFNCMVSIGYTMYDVINSLTVIGNFPVDKGMVVGLMKTFTGLGTAIVGTIQIAFFAGKTAEYFYFLSALGGGVGIPMVLFMKHAPYVLTGYQMKHLSPEKKEKLLATKTQYMKQRPPLAVFIYAFSLLFSLIIYLPIQSALVNYLKLDKTFKTAFAIVLIVVLVCALFVIPLTWLLTRNIKDDYRDPTELQLQQMNANESSSSSNNHNNNNSKKKNEKNSLEELNNDDEEKKDEIVKEGEVVECVLDDGIVEPIDGEVMSTQEEQMQQEEEETETETKRVETEIDFIAPQYQTSFFRNLLTLRLWALFWCVFATVGPELSITYNATYMYAAVAEAPQSESTRILLSVLNGSASAIGRLSMSFLENWSQKKPADKRIPITFTLFIPCVTVIIALILFLTIPGSGLPAAFVLNSYGNGFFNAAMVLVTRIMYARDQAKHYHMCFLACCAGVLIFTRLVFAEWYAQRAKKLGEEKICFDRSCARVPHIIMLCCTCSGTLAVVYVHVKYTLFCRRVLEERNRLYGEEEVVHENNNNDDNYDNNNYETRFIEYRSANGDEEQTK